MRSPETSEFNLLNVAGPWQVWKGVIDTSDVNTVCNICSENTDCNLNGKCVAGKCECKTGDGGEKFLCSLLTLPTSYSVADYRH